MVARGSELGNFFEGATTLEFNFVPENEDEDAFGVTFSRLLLLVVSSSASLGFCGVEAFTGSFVPTEIDEVTTCVVDSAEVERESPCDFDMCGAERRGRRVEALPVLEDVTVLKIAPSREVACSWIIVCDD